MYTIERLFGPSKIIRVWSSVCTFNIILEVLVACAPIGVTLLGMLADGLLPRQPAHRYSKWCTPLCSASARFFLPCGERFRKNFALGLYFSPARIWLSRVVTGPRVESRAALRMIGEGEGARRPSAVKAGGLSNVGPADVAVRRLDDNTSTPSRGALTLSASACAAEGGLALVLETALLRSAAGDAPFVAESEFLMLFLTARSESATPTCAARRIKKCSLGRRAQAASTRV